MPQLDRVVERIAAGTISVLHPRRDRRRQGGARRARSTACRRARAKPFLRLNCARAARDAARERAVRPRARRVHRRDPGASPGLLETARRRHRVPRRDRRAAARRCRPSSCACSRSAQVLPRRRARAAQPIDVRFIAATNRDLEAEVDARRVPPGSLLPAQRRHAARSRRCASAPTRFAALARRFVDARRAASARRRRCSRRDAAPRSTATRWPGNVRELRNVIERAVLLAPRRGRSPSSTWGSPRARLRRRRSKILPSGVASFSR